MSAFVTDLQRGEIPANGNADEAFSSWKQRRYAEAVQAFADDWGVQPDLLESAVNPYDLSAPDVIPRLDDIRDTLDYDHAAEQHGDYFDHGCALEDRLPEWIREVRETYLEGT